MRHRSLQLEALEPHEREFYCNSLRMLNEREIPYLIGGAYAFACYTGIERHTKDFDIFVKPEDVDRTLEAFAEQGYKTELTFPHWLGKAYNNENFVDVIFGSGNGVAVVDDRWFDNAIEQEICGIPVKLCPPEEIIWSKSLIMERERFDGADIAHLLLAQAEHMDWPRLLERMGPFWRVLLSHVVLFGFIYPCERDKIPGWLIDELTGRLQAEQQSPPSKQKICQGTIISRQQYLPDIEKWGYKDGRLVHRTMTKKEIAHWTAAIEEQEQQAGA